MPPLSLDYVSPLPPVRSGISDYSTDLLPHIEPLCDLRVVRLPGQPVTDEVAARWQPVESERLGEAGRLPLYHMGNNQYHADVYRLAMEHPGVVTLHDLVLHHFLLGATLGHGFGEFDRYRRRLGMEHGWVGDVAASGVKWGTIGNSIQFSLPANRRLVSRQRGILVHSGWARDMLLEEAPGLRVRTVPMGIPLPERIDPARGTDFRQRFGIPLEAPLLGSFGFQTPMKRTEVIVRALLDPALAEVHLVIAGAVAPTLELDRDIREAGIGDRVHVTGFLSQEDFGAAISACDLCLNLRYPSAGETSAALLRVLAYGKPTLVSEYAQFAELPAAAAARVPVGDGECRALVQEISGLLGSPEVLRSMGEEAREYVRSEHDPAGAGAAVVEACSDLADGERSATVVGEPMPTSIAWSRLDGEIEVSGLETEWPEGSRRTLRVRVTNGSRAVWLAGATEAGGMGLEVTFTDPDGRTLTSPHRVPLPHDLAPGESVSVEVSPRRPLGPARLEVMPYVRGWEGFSEMSVHDLGGPQWGAQV